MGSPICEPIDVFFQIYDLYKCERNGETVEMRFDVSEIDKDEAVSDFYADEQEAIAECYLENNIKWELQALVA